MKEAERFPLVPPDRTSGHKLTHRRLCLNIGDHFFAVRVTKCWHRLLGKVINRELQEPAGHGPWGNLLYVALLEQGSLQTSTIL